MLARKNKKDNEKGFTLAELLVVVAIIAILVAVSIPVFTGKVEASKETTDVANMRASKAVAANAFYNEEYLDSTVWSANPVSDSSGSGALLGYDYSSIYDAENGNFTQDWADIEPYGKGTKSDGGMTYGDYKSGDSYEDCLIQVVISIRTGYPEEIITRWFKARSDE